jgi:hypothetical protein
MRAIQNRREHDGLAGLDRVKRVGRGRHERPATARAGRGMQVLDATPAEVEVEEPVETFVERREFSMKDWVTETTECWSKSSTSLAKSASDRSAGRPCTKAPSAVGHSQSLINFLREMCASQRPVALYRREKLDADHQSELSR